LNAESRPQELRGTPASQWIRYERARIPGFLWERKAITKGQAITITRADFEPIYREWGDSIYSRIFEVYVDDSNQPIKAIIKECNIHPVSDEILNINFLRYEEKKRFRINLPIYWLNEENCLGVKQGGSLLFLRNHIDIVYKGPSKDIPPVLAIDLQNCPKGKVIRMQELDLPAGVEVYAPLREQVLAVVRGFQEEYEEDEEEKPKAAVAAAKPAPGAAGGAAKPAAAKPAAAKPAAAAGGGGAAKPAAGAPGKK
jgi:large subunit ribosomal protein L25